MDDYDYRTAGWGTTSDEYDPQLLKSTIPPPPTSTVPDEDLAQSDVWNDVRNSYTPNDPLTSSLLEDTESNMVAPPSPLLTTSSPPSSARSHPTAKNAQLYTELNSEASNDRLFTSVSVTDPRKETAKDVHISYKITTMVMHPLCHNSCRNSITNSIKLVWCLYIWFTAICSRRRYQDFAWLYSVLTVEYPQCIIAPPPEKYRMGYLTGNRFDDEFIEKRRAGLERFIRRIARHPLLQLNEHVKQFLTNSNLNREEPNVPERDTLLDSLGDSILNAFSKLKNPDQRFIDIKETTEKLEENLLAIEKIYQKMTKHEMGDIVDLINVEPGMAEQLNGFASTITHATELMKEKTYSDEHAFVTQLREYGVYCQCVKNVLRLRDQKQIDYEVLQTYLQQQQEEQNDYRTLGKYEEMKGVDMEQARQQKLQRLEKQFLQQYAESQAEFYRKSATLWDDLIPKLEQLEIDDE
ncbi:Phox homologous domain-containing protein [Syncephalis plumigaleata]|nr:Phox homologous domain-containing protein [Syncephalis plumigaleata]